MVKRVNTVTPLRWQICAACQRSFPVAANSRGRERLYCRAAACKAKRSTEKVRAWRAANPEQAKATERRWRDEHPARMLGQRLRHYDKRAGRWQRMSEEQRQTQNKRTTASVRALDDERRPLATRKGQRWTDEENAFLRANPLLTDRVAAAALSRTRPSVHRQRRKLREKEISAQNQKET